MYDYIFEVQDLGVLDAGSDPQGDRKPRYQHSVGFGYSLRAAVRLSLVSAFGVEVERYQEAERLINVEQFDDTRAPLPLMHFALVRYRSPIMMHYGVGIDLRKPTTGVLLAYGAEWLHECTDEGIDLDLEEHLSKCKNEDHDTCGPEQMGTVLIGHKKHYLPTGATIRVTTITDDPTGRREEVDYRQERREYQWIPDPEAEFSAIVGDTYCQVIRSAWISRCTLCSPCYPGQGDLGIEGDIMTYTLPEDIWGNNEHLPIEKWEEPKEN